jgi:RNA polymerase sigma factor (TIGR02999 family)
MDSPVRQSTTQALIESRGGDGSAVARLMSQVYEELRRLAVSYLQRERRDHTLEPTALVHEAFMRLVDDTKLGRLDRNHFFAIAANVMRRVLVEHARAHHAQKRGGDALRVTLAAAVRGTTGEPQIDVIALDDVLQRLARLDERQSRVVELRFFGGMTMEQVAEVLGVSKRSAENDWELARAWLRRELSR